MATRSLGTLTVDIVAKTGLLEQGMERAARQADSQMRNIERSARRAGVAIGVGIGALATGLGIVVKNTIDAERNLAQLDAILQSTGNAAGYTRDQLVQMAQQFQDRSTFGSNEIIEAQTRLLSYSGVLGENIPRAMQAIMDQSARLNMSLTQSAETIGRALESPARAASALAQQGFGAAFTQEVRSTIQALVDAGREAEAQVMILEILEESYGGAAEAARNTLGGALTALRHNITTLMTGGPGSLDGATSLVNDLNDALSDPKFRQSIDDLITGFFELGRTISGVVGPAIETLTRLRNAMAGIEEQSQAVGRGVRGALSGSRSEMAAAARDYEAASLKIDSAFKRMQGPDQDRGDLFRNVTGGVVRPAVDTSDLISPEIQKMVDSINQQAEAYGKTRLELAELNRERALSEARTQAEKDAINESYDALTRAISATESARTSRSRSSRDRDAERQIREMQQLAQAQQQWNDRLLDMQAAIDGPVAQAHRNYESLMSALNRAFHDGEVALSDYVRLQEVYLHNRNEELKQINELRTPYERMLEDLEFEYDLIGMTNREREIAIAQRWAEVDATSEQGKRLAELVTRNMEYEERMRSIVEAQDAVRSGAADFLTDAMTGAKRFKDAALDALDSIHRRLSQMVAEKLVEQLFGQAGGSGGGQAGGWLASIIGAMFGGQRANGGWAAANRMFEVNERGFEMATVGGRDYMLTGNQPVQITPNHRIGFGGGGVTNNFAFASPVSPKTQTQMAARVGYEVRRSQRFGT